MSPNEEAEKKLAELLNAPPAREPVYYRTCQECGYEQVARDPQSYAEGNKSWRELECKKCGSPALDYGSWRETNPYWAKKDAEAWLKEIEEDEASEK